MKKLYTLLSCAAVAMAANAQQIPNSDFETAWTDCQTWSSKGTNKVGTTPAPWNLSNVKAGGIVDVKAGEEAAGYNSSKAVLLKNQNVSGSDVPGYITLGTPWSTACTKVTTVVEGSKDGGAWGGYDFKYTPDALSFYYKTSGDAAPTVVAYLWNGTYVQAAVPANIAVGIFSAGKATTVNMENRDRNILGMDTPLGGAVTQQGTRIAKVNTRIENPATDWTEFTVPFEYENNQTPEKINVIISAGDYFSTTVVNGMQITVDDFKLIYYSRLASLKVGEQEIALVDGTYEYAVDDYLPADASAFAYQLIGHSAKADVALNAADNTAVITVSNDGDDVDGEKSHVYTLTFKEKPVATPDLVYNGTVTIDLGGTLMVVDGNVNIFNTGDNQVRFELPNFSLMGLNFGSIIVENVTTETADGTTTYTGHVDDMKLVEPDMGMEIHAAVDLSGTVKADGEVYMSIPVIWYMDGDVTNTAEDNVAPIDVTFTDIDMTASTVNIGGEAVESDKTYDLGVTETGYDINFSHANADVKFYVCFIDQADATALAEGTVFDGDGNIYTECATGQLHVDHAGTLHYMPVHARGLKGERTTLVFSGKTGVEDIAADADDTAAYYNMQGVRVATPAHGNLYIKVTRGGHATKVLVK